MIDDPIVLPPHLEQSYYSAMDYSNKSGRRFIEINKGDLSALYYFNNEDYVFGIISGGNRYVRPKYGPVTPEVFLDLIREKYPDHFEWLLFHPKWL